MGAGVAVAGDAKEFLHQLFRIQHRSHGRGGRTGFRFRISRDRLASAGEVSERRIRSDRRSSTQTLKVGDHGEDLQFGQIDGRLVRGGHDRIVSVHHVHKRLVEGFREVVEIAVTRPGNRGPPSDPCEIGSAVSRRTDRVAQGASSLPRKDLLSGRDHFVDVHAGTNFGGLRWMGLLLRHLLPHVPVEEGRQEGQEDDLDEIVHEPTPAAYLTLRVMNSKASVPSPSGCEGPPTRS